MQILEDRGQEPEPSHKPGNSRNCLNLCGGLFVFCPQAAEKIGFPLMIKASEGGGGKGIQKAETAEDFPILFRQVSSSHHVFCHMSLGIVLLRLVTTRFFPLMLLCHNQENPWGELKYHCVVLQSGCMHLSSKKSKAWVDLYTVSLDV